jgi:hypothetical protein
MTKIGKKAGQDFFSAVSKVFDRVKTVALWSAKKINKRTIKGYGSAFILDDASYQKKGLEKIFSDLLKTSEEQLSTDNFTNICRRLDEIQKLEDTKFSKFVVSEMQSLKGMESNPKIQLIPPRTQ